MTNSPLDYFREMGSEVYESEKGWANYIFDAETCYIENIHVYPEFRKQGEASKIADKITEIAKERGCKYLLGSTNTTKPHVERSMMTLLGYGFEYLSSSQEAILYKKEI